MKWDLLPHPNKQKKVVPPTAGYKVFLHVKLALNPTIHLIPLDTSIEAARYGAMDSL